MRTLIFPRYEGAVETQEVLGWVLKEDPRDEKLYWHFVDANLSHNELSCSTDVHKVRCGEHVGGFVWDQRSGHHVCADCLAALTDEEKATHGL